MVLSRRGERKEGKHAKNKDAPSDNGSSGNGRSANGSSANGSSVDAEAPRFDPETSRPLLNVLLERHLITNAQIDQALAAHPKTESELSDVFVTMGFIDERNLEEARARALRDGGRRSSTDHS